MNNYENSLWNPSFSHVYIEEAIASHPRTIKILSQLKNTSIIVISHYKDVFCKKNQQFTAQKGSPQLILAAKKENYLYKGSPLCDDFGNADFYYSSDIMNCPYQCEYCYLQGLYPSANLVVFVNLEDTFHELEIQLAKKPLYVCISYDTDMLALESLTGFVSDWVGFASTHPSLTIELRTKSVNFVKISNFNAPGNLILAWSISPEPIIKSYEHHTPSLNARLKSMKHAMDKGWKVRLCIDPMIHISDWKAVYFEMFKEVQNVISIENLYDYSIGVFRVPKDNLKIMRGINTESSLLAYPFTLSASGWSYHDAQKEIMTGYMKGLLVSNHNQITNKNTSFV